MYGMIMQDVHTLKIQFYTATFHFV